MIDFPSVAAPAGRERDDRYRSLRVDLADLGERWRAMDALNLRSAAEPQRERAGGGEGERCFERSHVDEQRARRRAAPTLPVDTDCNG